MFSAQSVPIYLCCAPVDMRKSIDGLAMLVEQFDQTPTSGSLYVFCSKSCDKIKILYWDRNGFCLWYKRLEKEKFHVSYWSSGVVRVDQQQLRWLLDGLDYTQLQGHKKLAYEAYF